MVSNQAYISTEIEFNEFKQSDNKNNSCNLSDNNVDSEEAYSYDEAIALAGNGCYNIGLLASMSLTLLAMTIDMFGFSTIVALCSCEFDLDSSQKSILLSMPFLGPVFMAYGWGYISDTRGRRKALTYSMSVGFLLSALCAIAPNWIALAIFKLIGCCLCSCAQSVSFTLLGESCPNSVKGSFLIVMSGITRIHTAIYFGIAYGVITLDYSFIIPGFITFLPWRLLALIQALPLGFSAFSLLFFYESPKFLLNAGREDEALELLMMICKRNGQDPKNYPVKKLVLTEVGNVRCKNVSLLKSMWEQTVPLFKPPLLLKTLLLYYLIIVIYIPSNSVFVWLPFLSEAFSRGVREQGREANGLCGFISETSTTNTTSTAKSCNSAVELPLVAFASVTGFVLYALTILMSMLSSRKKTLTITLFLISSACCIGTVHIPHNITNIVLYFGILLDSMLVGVAFSYCVDLYPTSFRGMASCLGVMMARLSSVAGVNLVGPNIMSHCYQTFYSLAAMNLSGAIAACFLPPDRPQTV